MTRPFETNGLTAILQQLLLFAALFFAAQMVHACPMHEGLPEPAAPMASADMHGAHASAEATNEEMSSHAMAAPAVCMSPATPADNCDRFHLCCVTPAALPPNTNVLAGTTATHEAPHLAPETPSSPLLPQPTPPPIA